MRAHDLKFLKRQRAGCGKNLVWDQRLAVIVQQARQIVTHGHILVDGQKCNMPGFQVKPGMTVSVREKSRKVPALAEGAANQPAAIPEYLERATDSFEGKMIAAPNIETIPFKPDTAGIIGFYSR